MPYKSIVCGVTGSDHAQKAALESARLAKSNHADLAYVYAVDLAFVKGGKTGRSTPHLVEETLDLVGEQILNLAEQIALKEGVTAVKLLIKGPVHEVLKEAIVKQKADLLVLGHEERTFFEKFLLEGEVEDHIDKLKRETGVDVLVVD